MVPSRQINYYIQACESQEATRNAAEDLLAALDSFIDIYGAVPTIAARDKAKDAQRVILMLIARIASYIREHTSTKILGTPLPHA